MWFILCALMLYNPPSIAVPLGVTAGGTGTTIQFTPGSVIFAGTNGVYSQNNSKLFWDNTLNRLGIGNTVPAQALDVTGAIVASSRGTFNDVSVTNAGYKISGTGGNGFNVQNGGFLIAGSDGVWKFSNVADNDWGRLQFGGTSAAYPAIGRSGTTLAFRLADNSADCPISASTASLSGKIPTYNNIATVGNGVPSEVATIDTTGLTANVGASTLYAVPASGGGLYRVCAYVVETVAGSLTSTLPNVQILYTDLDSNTAVTIDATPVLGVAGIGQTGALTANTVGTVDSGVIPISVKASTTIQYQTVNYASNAAGMTYALHIKLEVL